MDFAIPADHWVKMKENEKINRYLVLTRALQKHWYMKVTIISIIFGALGTFFKDLQNKQAELKFKGRIETTQTTGLLTSTRMLRRVLETWEDLLSSDSREFLLTEAENIAIRTNYVNAKIDKTQV